VRTWFVSLFILLFTFQSIAAVIETGSQGEHDEFHHQFETEQFAVEHTISAEIDEGDHEGHHVHLCHHHHGEHNPQVLLPSPSFSIQHFPLSQAILTDGFYLSQLTGPLLRPPIQA
jgi:hypothetical protein